MGNGRHHRALFPPGELQWITEADFIACVTSSGWHPEHRPAAFPRPPTRRLRGRDVRGRCRSVGFPLFVLVVAPLQGIIAMHRQSSGSAVSLHNGPAPEQQLMAVGYCSNESTRQVVYYTLEVAAEIELIIQVCCAVIIHRNERFKIHTCNCTLE